MIFKNLFLEGEKTKLKLPKSAEDKSLVAMEFNVINLLDIKSKSIVKACYRGKQLDDGDKYYNLHLNHLTEGDYRVVTRVEETNYMSGTIESIETKTASNGGEFCDIIILVNETTCDASKGDKVKIKLWDRNIKSIEGVLTKNDYIFIENPSYEEKYNQWLPKSIIIEEKGILGFNVEKQYINLNNLNDWVEQIIEEDKNNEYNLRLATFIRKLIKDNEDLLLIAPAAKKNHHSYIGGLVHHILEVCKLGATTAATYNGMFMGNDVEKANPALVIAGCIAHDFGKIFEYKYSAETGEISYNNEFSDKWKNNKVPAHIEWGYFTFKAAGFDDVADIIASHHKSIEYGARFEPRTIEQHIVFIADYASTVLGYNDLHKLKHYLKWQDEEKKQKEEAQ